MAAGRMLRIRVDKPSTKDRIAERMEAIAETRGASLNSLVLAAMREYVEREEGTRPDIEELNRLLDSATRLMGAVTDSVSAMRDRQTTSERCLVYAGAVLWEVMKQVYKGEIPQELDRWLYRASPHTPEMDQLARELADTSDTA